MENLWKRGVHSDLVSELPGHNDEGWDGARLRLVVREELLQIERLVQAFAQGIGEFGLGQRMVEPDRFVQGIDDYSAIGTGCKVPLNLGAQRL